jgi:hypothetical protein
MRLTAFLFAASLAPLIACGAHQSIQGTGVVLPVEIGEGSGDDEPDPVSTKPPAARAPGAAAGSAAAQPAGSPAPSAAPPGASSAPPGHAALPLESSPPDPQALRTADQLEYTIVYENGAARVGSVRRVRFERPVVTTRKMGRFAVELWIGRELLDRVRFDFPLLAAEEPRMEGERRPLYEPPALTKGPISATVMVPYSERARRAVLIDRATGQLTELSWPPAAPVAAPAP